MDRVLLRSEAKKQRRGRRRFNDDENCRQHVIINAEVITPLITEPESYERPFCNLVKN